MTVNTGVTQRHLNGNRDKQHVVLEGKVPAFLVIWVVRVTVVAVSNKQADKSAFWDQICVDQEVGDTWWRALAKPGLRHLTQIQSLPFE